jgi:hypothetical protein
MNCAAIIREEPRGCTCILLSAPIPAARANWQAKDYQVRMWGLG